MTSGNFHRYWLLAILLASLSACSSSETEIAAPDDDDDIFAQGPLVPADPLAETPQSNDPDSPTGTQDDPVGEETVVPVDEPIADEEPTEEEAVVPDDSQPGDEGPSEEEVVVPDGGQPGDGGPVEEETVVPDDSQPGDAEPTEEETVVPDDSQTEDAEPTEEETVVPDNNQPGNEEPSGEETVVPDDSQPGDEEPTEEETAAPDTTGLLIPQTAPGSDLDRLIKGLHRQLSTIVLSLNRALSQGEELSDVQERCLGAFDPGVGEQLVGIDCGNVGAALNDIPIYTRQASFYDTPACQVSLSEQKTDACVLYNIDALMPTEWDSIPGQIPVPVFPGASISYSVADDDGTLRINSLRSSLSGAFLCSLDLTSAQLTGAANRFDCRDTIKNMADQLEKLQGL